MNDDDGAPDHVVEFFRLARQVFKIDDSSANAETKHDLIFSEGLSRAIQRLISFDYISIRGDGHEQDIHNYVYALRKKYDELRKIWP